MTILISDIDTATELFFTEVMVNGKPLKLMTRCPVRHARSQYAQALMNVGFDPAKVGQWVQTGTIETLYK